jgi:hypothetical protein
MPFRYDPAFRREVRARLLAGETAGYRRAASV